MKYQEAPIGQRQRLRLQERLLAHTEAKKLVKELVTQTDHRKRATSLLYTRTGGNKWITPQQVAEIVEETRA